MSIIVRGEPLGLDLITTSAGGRRNPDGTMTASVTYAVAKSSLISVLPKRGVTTHPYLDGFVCDDFSWAVQRGNVVLLTVTYIALAPLSSSPSETALPPDIEVECSSIATEEPVTTLPNFLKPVGSLAAIAAPTDGAWPVVDSRPVTVDPTTGRFPINTTTGKPLTISNGAVFDTFGQNKTPSATIDFNPQVGRFLYFAPGSKFVGLEAVLVPRGEYRYTYSTLSTPNLSGVGRIGTPPGAPTLNTGYTWLRTSRTFRKTGLVYRVTESWRVSGPRGWMEEIYGTPET